MVDHVPYIACGVYLWDVTSHDELTRPSCQGWRQDHTHSYTMMQELMQEVKQLSGAGEADTRGVQEWGGSSAAFVCRSAQQCAAAPDRISRSLTNLYHSQGSVNIMPGLLPRVFWCHFGSKIVSIQNLQFQSVFLQAWSSLTWKHVDFWYNMAITSSWCFCQKFGSIRTSMTMLKTTETMQCRPSPLVSFG